MHPAISTENLYGVRSYPITERRPTKHEVDENWDMQKNPPKEIPIQDNEWMKSTLKVIKFLTYIISFVLVLAGCMFSKLSLLVMTSQLKESKTADYCLITNDATEYTAKITAHERSQWIWSIFFVFFVPEGLTFLRSARMCIFKTISRPKFIDFILVGLIETLHTIGVALLVYVVLPEMEATRGAMLTNCVALAPAILSAFSRHKETFRVAKTVGDVLATLAQLSGLIVWPVLYALDSSMENSRAIWAIPVSLFLISLGWWENYIDKRSEFVFVKFFSSVKERLKHSRYFIYFFISIWKIIVFLLTMAGFVALTSDSGWEQVRFLYDNFLSVDAHNIPVTGVNNLDVLRILTGTHKDYNSTTTTQLSYPATSTTPVYTLLIQMFSAFIAYSCAKFACRTCIQGFGFAFPTNLVMPVVVTLLISACGNKSIDVCNLSRVFPPYIYWNCQEMYTETAFTDYEMAIWILWIVSQAWITIHIFLPSKERLATTEKLFILPEYSGVLIDQSLCLNRRRDDVDAIKVEELQPTDEAKVFHSSNGSTSSYTSSAYSNYASIPMPNYGEPIALTKVAPIPRIYACATMWHEDKKEMLAILQSIFRMDFDQCARRLAQTYLEIVDPDYYEFTTHIFFDDAFNDSETVADGREVNPYVRQLYDVMDEAASKVHATHVFLPPPRKIETPYGGRLEWSLPGRNKLIVHLKDKDKIRHRKRWSQCMYMFYLLRYLHKELVRGLTTAEEKHEIAENTFLLALDGDIDFKPEAVQLLIDLMKKNKLLGAACGRIHPTGSGWMVWYQKFEYAIGHWLQKSTEHILGCVLCSPGCFSMFRGSALLNKNVILTYTTTSEEARHYVQYDQGEDRWLCTLLLQQGYRVEYSAAADAFTHCPESFSEFFNQRRRWLPSTMANILDLLTGSGATIKVNDNISFPYILYQALLMFGTILGPGTIFLMLIGAFVAAFGIASRPAFYMNLIPISIFVIVCFTCKSKIQIRCAEVLTALYSMVMMAVLVGICLQVKEDGWSAPSSAFLVVMFGSMFVAALLHPLEVSCIMHIVLYWMVIPSMYLLLVIFSLTNMHDVSWGTRETPKTQKQLEEEAREAEEVQQLKSKKKSKNKIFDMFSKNTAKYEGGCGINCGRIFSCMVCGNEKSDDKVPLLKISENLEMINKKFDRLESARRKSSIGKVLRSPQVRFSMTRNLDEPFQRPQASINESDQELDDVTPIDTSDSDYGEADVIKEERNKPTWDKCLGNNHLSYLSSKEKTFWQEFIAKYLAPILEDRNFKKRVSSELKSLRNKMVFIVFMCNALFILVVSLLQMNKDKIYINWPLGAKNNITFNDKLTDVQIKQEFLHLEPTGFIFIIFFGVIIVIQFVSMLFHRLGTMVHLLASTEIEQCTRRVEVKGANTRINQEMLNVVRDLQRLNGPQVDEGDIYGDDSDSMRNRGAGSRRLTLDAQFVRRFTQTAAEINKGAPVLKNMIKHRGSIHPDALKEVERRASLFVRRNSAIHMEGSNDIEEFNRHQHPTLPNSRRSSVAFANDITEYSDPEDTLSQNSVIEDTVF